MAIYNIAENKNFKWTTTEGSYLSEVPRIYATSYEIDNNQVLDSIRNYLEQATSLQSAKEYYDKLHKTSSEQDQWVFPFFGDTVRGFTNDWGDQLVLTTTGGSTYFSELHNKVQADATNILAGKGVIDTVINYFSNKKAAGSLFEPPKFYQYAANDEGIVIEFTLINTEGEGDAEANYGLVSTLIYQNRFDRTGGLTVVPARLWKVFVPGYRTIRWAAADVGVQLLGHRKYNAFLRRLIPEGYRVSITYKSLYTEPRSVMNDYDVD